MYGDTLALCLAKKIWWPNLAFGLDKGLEKAKNKLGRIWTIFGSNLPFLILINMSIVSMDTGKRITSVNKHSMGQEIYFSTCLYITSPPWTRTDWPRPILKLRLSDLWENEEKHLIWGQTLQKFTKVYRNWPKRHTISNIT